MAERDDILPLARLPRGAEREFDLRPGPEARAALADEMGLLGLKKLRLAGRLIPEGRRDWRLEAVLGATVVQPCVVTTEPVTTRIDEPVLRRYLADMPAPAPGEEVEMPEDDSAEPLPASLDLSAVMAEALALALPLYPRAAGSELGAAAFAPPGAAPLTDDDVKPLAGLGALRDRLGGGEDGAGGKG
jgi:uncharacterized metal-binding protein YceD (DUF177 family)